MSITFIQEPDLFSSGFDPLIFLASSNQTTQTNFRYRIQVRDASGAVVAEFRKPPYYADGTCDFDAHRTVENYLSYDISNLIAGSVGFKKGVNVFEKYTVNIGEEYGTIPSLHASANSNFRYAVNGAMDYAKWINSPIDDLAYKSIIGTSGTFLTYAPSPIVLRESDSYELGFITFGTDSCYSMRITTYDANGTQLKQSVFNNPFKTNANDDEHFLSMLVGTANINSWTVSSGSAQPLISSSVSTYKVEMLGSGTDLISYAKTFKIDRECTRTGTYNRLFWLNPLGRFDAFNFTQTPDDMIETMSETYNKLLPTRTSSGISYNVYSRAKSNFYNKSTQKYLLRSGYVDTATSNWLKELVQSPLVYMIIDGQFIPINIKTTSYTTKNTLQSKLFNIELEVELANDTYRQRL